MCCSLCHWITQISASGVQSLPLLSWPWRSHRDTHAQITKRRNGLQFSCFLSRLFWTASFSYPASLIRKPNVHCYRLWKAWRNRVNLSGREMEHSQISDRMNGPENGKGTPEVSPRGWNWSPKNQFKGFSERFYDDFQAVKRHSPHRGSIDAGRFP